MQMLQHPAEKFPARLVNSLQGNMMLIRTEFSSGAYSPFSLYEEHFGGQGRKTWGQKSGGTKILKWNGYMYSDDIQIDYNVKY